MNNGCRKFSYRINHLAKNECDPMTLTLKTFLAETPRLYFSVRLECKGVYILMFVLEHFHQEYGLVV